MLISWAYGLGGLLLFKIPNILANAGFRVVQENLYQFFFGTLLIYFLAYFAILHGLCFFTKFARCRLTAVLSLFWIAGATLYFAASFLIPSLGVERAPVWVSHIIFYIPVQLLLLITLWRIHRQPTESLTVSKTGVVLTSGGVVALFFSSVLYVSTQTGPYPRAFWYFSVISSEQISVLQIIGGVLLFLGLRIFAKSYLNTKARLAASK